MTPFYQKALALFTETQKNQIQKGMEKYPEPFNPHSWTPEELLNHALEETVDLTHYLVGLKELLDAKDRVIERQNMIIESKDEEISKLNKARGKAVTKYKMDENGNLTRQYDMNFNPHFDQDDQ